MLKIKEKIKELFCRSSFNPKMVKVMPVNMPPIVVTYGDTVVLQTKIKQFNNRELELN